MTQRASIPTVRFDPSRVTAVVEADIRSTLLGVPEVADREFAVVFESALRSVRLGGDLRELFKALLDQGMGKSRATEISRLINNRASALMTRDRQIALGVREAKWLHSGAPCVTNVRKPSPDEEQQSADHLAANGQHFVVAEGMLLNGRRVWPGQDPGCKCVSISIIPGFG